MSNLPLHLQADRCYICGGTEHEDRPSHSFWSNADAEASHAEEDARLAAGQDPAARYVATYRPY